ncbi:MAG: hypothetical protein DRQ60_01545 [Gammaproteobacteria bacterium]|nr:MAG: hypothetical protein DRQ60_01545 [Gammaproteobacteria bacterium]
MSHQINLPDYSPEELSRFRLQECQGTMIGGMVAAANNGVTAMEHGYQMMALQQVDWSQANSAEKIAMVFWKHYQSTYGFGDQLTVTDLGERIVMTMPSLARAAVYQLRHWAASAEQLNDLQRGYWQAIEKLCDVGSELVFSDQEDRVTLLK